MSEEQKEVQPEVSQEAQPEAKFTQQDLDKIVQERLSREKQKFSDYEDLRKKAQEFESLEKQRQEQDMERKQEYDKLKESWLTKENEYKALIEQKEAAINAERMSNALSNEVMKSGGYPEAIDLLKSQAVIEDGMVKIKGKDSNGMETLLDVEAGVKQFLESKPYLVKASTTRGSGTSPAVSGGNQVDTQTNLAADLQEAMRIGDRKRVNELKTLIRAKHSGAGVKQII